MHILYLSCMFLSFKEFTDISSQLKKLKSFSDYTDSSPASFSIQALFVKLIKIRARQRKNIGKGTAKRSYDRQPEQGLIS
jgi:hypothetical protein